jgi:large subunit ribosomal protein L21
VAGASVSGEVVDPVVMGEKLYIQKFRTKKAFKKKTGHRQRYTSVKITAIAG